MKRRLTLVTGMLALVVAFSSCTQNTKKENKDEFKETAFKPCCGEASPNTETLSIRLAVNDTYCKKTACACIHSVAAREYENLVKELKLKYNIDLQLTYFMEPYYMEDEMKKKTFDGVISKPWNAYMLSKEFKLNYKRIVDIRDAYNSEWLKGVYMVPKDSPIKTMADITGKVLVAGQKDAYEKYHAPFHQMDEMGIKPGRVYYKSSCLESINELIDGNADVAIVSDYVMTASCAVDVANPDDYRILGETENMPLTSVILDMDKIKKEDAMRLQKALLELSGANSPEGMLSEGFIAPASWIPNPYTKVTGGQI